MDAREVGDEDAGAGALLGRRGALARDDGALVGLQALRDQRLEAGEAGLIGVESAQAHVAPAGVHPELADLARSEGLEPGGDKPDALLRLVPDEAADSLLGVIDGD